MYDIRQFQPVLFTVLLMGIAGFAIATLAPELWILATAAVALNAWLVHTRRYRPLPRLAASAVTIAALLYTVVTFKMGGTPLIVVGQFLVLLQIVKLYECRSNRDYGQLLVLSLLLMVAAAISTASLLFGVLFVLYLYMALFCLLLFHLKCETDHAKVAMGLSEETANPLTLRQDQRFLSSSMRRLTGLVAAVGVAAAVIIFLFFPRGSGAGMLGPLPFRPSQTLTGFSDTVDFENVARITQNQKMVAHVKVLKDQELVRGGMSLMLRGLTLDVYNGADRNKALWQWTRSVTSEHDQPLATDANVPQIFAEREEEGRWIQDVTLDPTGTGVLFAMGGVTRFTPTTDMRLRYSRRDEVLQSTEPITATVRYQVVSRGTAIDQVDERQHGIDHLLDIEPTHSTASRVRSRIAPEIAAYARRADVSGSNASGPLVAQRKANVRVSPLDGDIAAAIERHLQAAPFEYSLDLTDKRDRTLDPMVWFLSPQGRRGHCEYFASAMTLMCQSLGMQARYVIGFKTDEFNDFSSTFEVRQSHAHAWVEVLLPDGVWRTYDPTSGRGADGLASREPGLWQRVKHLYDYLEYSWANSVVAYDRESRKNVIDQVDTSIVISAGNTLATAGEMKSKWSEVLAWFRRQENFLNVSTQVLSGLISFMFVCLVIAVLIFAIEKWRMRRRARRIGLGALPASDQLRLARQLGFYDELLTLLERHAIVRPIHLTPLEFSQSVSFLPSAVFNDVRRLTEIFYRIRYGKAELAAPYQKRLRAVIDRIGVSLGQPVRSER